MNNRVKICKVYADFAIARASRRVRPLKFSKSLIEALRDMGFTLEECIQAVDYRTIDLSIRVPAHKLSKWQSTAMENHRDKGA